MTTRTVTFGPGEKHQSGELYTDPSTGETFVLAKDVAIKADGRAYQCFRLEPAKNLGHVRLPDQPPRILIDSHMHIQSGRCATLAFLHDSVPGNLKRSSIENLGTGKTAKAMRTATPGNVLGPVVSVVLDGGTSFAGLKPLARTSFGTTFEVGMRFLERVDKLVEEMRPKDPYKRSKGLFVSGVVMTMDMEYAHIAGYFGIPIYNPLYASEQAQQAREDPVAYWYPTEKTTDQIGPSGTPGWEAYPGMGESLSRFESLKKKRQKEGIIGSVYDANGKRIHSVPIHCGMKMAPEEEVKLYEDWNKQLRNTKQAAIESKLAMLPMFHYDPRRWQSGHDLPFREVGTGGVFLGFKMYTAQGYRPWDPRIPNLDAYYALCKEKGIPILNHCTPEGAATYDRERYIRFAHPKDTSEDLKQKQEAFARFSGAMPPMEQMKDNPDYLVSAEFQMDAAATDYFNENFVSPKAWRQVLDRYPDLRLCLAHFGGNTDLGRDWGLEIIRMIEEGKYPNLYTDLSYSFVYPDFRELFKKRLKEHPKIREHVLFGTDWYMFLSQKTDLVAYCTTAKEFLDGIDKTLWPQFTEENPCRFYRIGEQIGRIAENLIKEKGEKKQQKGQKQKGRTTQVAQDWDSAEAMKEAQEAEKLLAQYAADIRGKAQVIKSRALTAVSPFKELPR